jgi:hypothetical protein
MSSRKSFSSNSPTVVIAAVHGLLMIAGLLAACATESLDGGAAGSADIDVTLSPIQQFGAGATGLISTDGNRVELGFAAAVAASGGYVFVVDSTVPGLVRLDPASRNWRLIRRMEEARGSGLHARPDLVVYLVDSYNRAVLELDESGYERRVFHDTSLVPVPIDVAQTNWGASILVADALTQRLVMFDGIPTMEAVLPSTLAPVAVAASINAIAATDEFVFVLDSASREVMQLDLYGRIVATYGEDELLAPTALAIDECQRIFVADRHPDGLFVTSPDYYGSSARAALPVEISPLVTDLWVDGNELYVAAGASGIHVLSIEPWCFAQ